MVSDSDKKLGRSQAPRRTMTDAQLQELMERALVHHEPRLEKLIIKVLDTRQELIGLPNHDEEQRAANKADALFLRAWRLRTDKLANRIGNTVLTLLGVGAIYIAGHGAREVGLVVARHIKEIAMSAFTGSLTITEIVPGKRWRLVDAIRYEIREKGSGLWIEVPAGFETDGATIPSPLRTVVAVWGTYGRAACLHDYFYSVLREDRLWHCDGSGGDYLHPAFDAAPIGGCGINRSYAEARRWADQQFYEAMIACGTSRPLAWAMWAAVRAFGGRAIKRQRQGV